MHVERVGRVASKTWKDKRREEYKAIVRDCSSFSFNDSHFAIKSAYSELRYDV